MDYNDGNQRDEEVYGTLTITLEDGKEVECNVLSIFEVDEKEYIALVPIGEEEVLIYTYEEDEEEMILDLIEGDEEFERVSEVFYEMFEDLAEEDEEDFEFDVFESKEKSDIEDDEEDEDELTLMGIEDLEDIEEFKEDDYFFDNDNDDED